MLRYRHQRQSGENPADGGVPVYSSASVAGLITTRAGVIQHFDAGTNRRGYNITSSIRRVTRWRTSRTRRCLPIVSGRTWLPHRVVTVGAPAELRRDATRNMDPMASAFAYYDYDETKGNMIYTAGKVQPKYFINASNNQYGLRDHR